MDQQKNIRIVLDLMLEDKFKAGENWQHAVDICEAHQGNAEFDRLQGLLYMIKGDIFTSNYWYRASGEAPVHYEPEPEWQVIYEAMTGHEPEIAA